MAETNCLVALEPTGPFRGKRILKILKKGQEDLKRNMNICRDWSASKFTGRDVTHPN